MNIDSADETDILVKILKEQVGILDCVVECLVMECPNYRKAMYNLGTLRESIRSLIGELSEDKM